MMTTEAAPAGAPSGEGLTFEKVWLMFQETREQMKETREQMREQTEEADRKLREQMKETDRKISKLGSRLGELIEHLTGS
ncbi:MAG: hypothetical protein LBG76_07445, partial [Treponema sp.]|nr:hypothetical protein [Treponema sp.]